MTGMSYLVYAGFGSACIVAALLIASRDFPRGAVLRAAVFALIATLAVVHPYVAWRMAGFARPSQESDLPREMEVLGVVDDGERVVLWFRAHDEVLAYSFIPHRSMYEALQRASRDLQRGKVVVLRKDEDGDKDQAEGDSESGTHKSLWHARAGEVIKKED